MESREQLLEKKKLQIMEILKGFSISEIKQISREVLDYAQDNAKL